jgi:hypothetical protein
VSKPPTPDEARQAAQKAAHAATKPVPSRPARPQPHVPRLPFPEPCEVMFHGLAGEIVNSVDAYTEACRPAVLIHLLAGCGAMIGRDPHMVAGFTKHPPSLWGLVVGGTSLGAKGTADATARAFLATVDDDFMTDRLLPAVSTGEGLIHHVRDESDNDEGVKDKRLLVIVPEFRTVMAQARREQSTLSPTLRLAWDSPWRLSVPNRNLPYKATGAHIVMVAHVTPGEFRAKIDPSEIAAGLLNRYLITASRSSKDLPNEPQYPDDLLGKYAARLRDAIGEARELGEKKIGMTEDARRLWVASYPDLKNPTGARSEDEEGILAAVVVRARPHVMRAGLIYALLDHRSIVAEEHLAAALALWRYSLDSARWLFRVSPDLWRVQQFIDEAGMEGRSREEISGLFDRHLTAAELDRLLDQLSADYEIRSVPTRGRPRTVYSRRHGEESEGSEGSP